MAQSKKSRFWIRINQQHIHLPSDRPQRLSPLSRIIVGIDTTPRNMDTSGKNKRVTMIKSVVGKVKSAQYALPDIVYGIESKMDKEGAGKGEVLVFFRQYRLPYLILSSAHSLIQHSYLLSNWKLGCRRTVSVADFKAKLSCNESTSTQTRMPHFQGSKRVRQATPSNETKSKTLQYGSSVKGKCGSKVEFERCDHLHLPTKSESTTTSRIRNSDEKE